MELQRKLRAAIALTLGSVAMVSTAMAQGYDAQVKDGFMLGAFISGVDIDDSSEGVRISDSTTGYKLTTGYQFNDYFAIEGSYVDFDEVKDDVTIGGVTAEVSAELDGVTLGIKGILPVHDKFSLHGKVGYLFWEADTKFAGVSDDSDDNDLFTGIGGEFYFAKNWSVLGEWERYEIDDVDVDLISLGVTYRFGR